MAVDDSNHINEKKQKLTEKLDRLNERKRNINIKIRQTKRALRNLNNQKPKVTAGRFVEASPSISSAESSVSSVSLSRSRSSRRSTNQPKRKTRKEPKIIKGQDGSVWKEVGRFLTRITTPKNSNRKTRKKSK